MGVSKFIAITLFAATLIASVEPHEGCSFNIASFKGPQKIFNVILKDESSTQSHFEWLTNCCDKNVNHISSIDFFSKDFNKKVAYDFSVNDAKLHGYSASFDPDFVKDHLSKRSDIKIAEEDSAVEINYVIPRDVRESPNPNLDRIDQAKFPLDKKYEFPNSAGKGVVVYIVDTGIRVQYNEFEGRAKSGIATCAGCKILGTDDKHGHGTHVAGIVGGKTFGVANKVTLIAVKVLNDAGNGQTSEVIAGLSFVIDEHKKNPGQKSVINMSLGGDLDLVLNDIVKKCTDNGIHVVVAAGNEAADACNASPASAKTAITVGATEDTGTEDNFDRVTDFSNGGECVDIFAPGRNIKSAGIGLVPLPILNNNSATKVFSGTSQASPHVAGTVALIIGEFGDLSPADMTNKLIGLATKDVIKPETLVVAGKASPNLFLRVPSP